MYEKLKIWQEAMELAEIVYKLIKQFPDYEKFDLASQIRRSAISIPSNIAEGKGRNSDKEFKQYLYIARGSLFELRTQLELARRLKYIKNTTEIKNKIIALESMMNTLINKL
jgi:four helix bundle protein